MAAVAAANDQPKEPPPTRLETPPEVTSSSSPSSPESSESSLSADADSEHVVIIYGPSSKMEAMQLDSSLEAIVKSSEHVVSSSSYMTIPIVSSMQRSAAFMTKEEKLDELKDPEELETLVETAVTVDTAETVVVLVLVEFEEELEEAEIVEDAEEAEEAVEFEEVEEAEEAEEAEELEESTEAEASEESPESEALEEEPPITWQSPISYSSRTSVMVYSPVTPVAVLQSASE